MIIIIKPKNNEYNNLSIMCCLKTIRISLWAVLLKDWNKSDANSESQSYWNWEAEEMGDICAYDKDIIDYKKILTGILLALRLLQIIKKDWKNLFKNWTNLLIYLWTTNNRRMKIGMCRKN